jgi:lipid-A-disaccharide synthase-like uncharacterized protein
LNRSRSTFNLLLLLLATSLPITWLAWRLTVQPSRDASDLEIKLQIGATRQRVDLHRSDDGEYHFMLDGRSGAPPVLSPEEFADHLYRQQHASGAHGWMWRLFNISSPIGFIWVSVGLLGQVLFTGRMVVQWLMTERSRQSIVPPAFWWMSLGGALMLLTYFMWRRDIVGVLGQSFGLIVYVRNLYFIHGTRGVVIEVTKRQAVQN